MGAPRLRFLGGAGTVTGSRFLVETEPGRVLVDCGLFQGLKRLRLLNWQPLAADPATIDAVAITHAHVDHLGYLPALVRDGFHGPILATPATIELAGIVLRDAARLQEEEAAYANRKGFSKHHPARPLYTSADAEEALARFTPLAFHTLAAAGPGASVRMRPAGHILGSATVTLTLTDHDRTILFSGDLGRDSHPLLRGPAPRQATDVVVVESTYGDRRHDDQEVSLDRMARVITRTAERGGTVIIPAFAVDRTEVVLLVLRRLLAEGRIPRLPVYADSPMALAVLDVYRKAAAAQDPQLRPGLGDGDPFDAGDLHEAHTPEESIALNELTYPSIIISASGMATGGRVLHHLARCLPDPRNAVILVGFQAAGTRGEQLAAGAPAIKMLGRYVPVRAQVLVVDAFSVHADADELVTWLTAAPPPETAYVVHGEPRASAALADRLAGDHGWTAVAPRQLEWVRLD
ncbi:MBL fold metallo-hydrolase [Rhabdothermincola sp.]|uniref:MBL fold metallo-hydrolase n=1 Tax=Rhabdothermincola sp. TaxID=2820405 RepID=UPI002FDFE060